MVSPRLIEPLFVYHLELLEFYITLIIISIWYWFIFPFSHNMLSLLQLGVLLDRRILFYIVPVFTFVLLYSKLPHKVAIDCVLWWIKNFQLTCQCKFITTISDAQELRFIIGSIPIFNLSAAIAASRMYVASCLCLLSSHLYDFCMAYGSTTSLFNTSTTATIIGRSVSGRCLISSCWDYFWSGRIPSHFQVDLIIIPYMCLLFKFLV